MLYRCYDFASHWYCSGGPSANYSRFALAPANLAMKLARKEALYHKLVFEVRYEYGLVYLDRCGTTANRIMQTFPEWIIKEEAVSPQGAPLINVSSGAHFSFGTSKYDFSLDQPINRETALTPQDIDLFTSQVDAVAQIVHEELELKTFLREGFRIWYLFATESEEDSQQWVSSLGGFHMQPTVAHAFGAKLEGQGCVAVLATADRKYRISINPVQRLEQLDVGREILTIQPHKLPKGQKDALLKQARARKRLLSNPEFAVLIDVDAYLEEPIDVSPGDFIRQSVAAIEQSLPRAFPGVKK